MGNVMCPYKKITGYAQTSMELIVTREAIQNYNFNHCQLTFDIWCIDIWFVSLLAKSNSKKNKLCLFALPFGKLTFQDGTGT